MFGSTIWLFAKKSNSPSVLNIYVALRNEAHGPYIFRPAQLLNYCIGLNLYLCCVMEAGGNRQNVHRWQVVTPLPGKEPSVFGRLDEIPMVKHIVHSEKVNRIQAVDEYRISQFVNNAFRNGTDYPLMEEDRFFIQIGEATITFIFMDVFRCSVVRNRSAQNPSTGLDAFLEQYMIVHPIRERESRRRISTPNITRSEAHDSLHCVLSWDMFSEILRNLDFHSRLKTKSVCSSWSLALTEPSPSYCIEIDFRNMRPRKTSRADSEGYLVAYLLDRAITTHTKTLVLTNLSRRLVPLRGMTLISSLLRVRGIQLSTIVINKCEVFAEFLDTFDDSVSFHLPCHLPRLMTACQRLIASHCTIKQPLSCCSGCILPNTRADVRYSDRPKPPVSITISHMTFDCRPIDCSEILRRIIAALERHCCPADYVRHQFRKLHAQWVRDVPYPDGPGWMAFRRMLQISVAYLYDARAL